MVKLWEYSKTKMNKYITVEFTEDIQKKSTDCYSDILLADCLNRIENIRENALGFAFVTLSSTDEGYNLYEQNGFSPLEEDMKIAKNSGEMSCIPMYLPIDYE